MTRIQLPFNRENRGTEPWFRSLSASLTIFGLWMFAVTNACAQIEEIIVTAKKRSERAQDVGLSVSAFGEQSLKLGGITDVSRLELLVPGVNFAYAGNDAKFNVRGANSTNTFADNASIVGTYVDGVYKPRSSQQSRAFFDVERVEFLKGPQGTLYGRNTFAGALNLYTNKPNLDGYSGSVELGHERFSTVKFQGFVNVPLNDQFALRIAGFFEEGDSFVKNNAGPNAGAPNDRGIRLSALWTPADNFDALLRVSSITENGTAAGLFGYKNICRYVTPQGLTDPLGSDLDCQNPNKGSNGGSRGDTGPYAISQDFVPDADLAEDNLSVELNWDFDTVSLKSITSYTDFRNLLGFDFDFSPNPFNPGWFEESAESFTQELQLSSDSEDRFQWTTGAYYSSDETFFSFSIFNQTLENGNRATVAGPGGSEFPILSGTPIVSTATNIHGFFADSAWIESDVFAVFAQGEFSVNDNMRLIAGLRYNDEKKSVAGGGSNFTAGDAPVTVLIPAASSPSIIPQHRGVFGFNRNATGANAFSRTYDNVSWKAGIEYDIPDRDAMVYFMASTGFLSGSVNGNGSSTDEQESQLVEIGFKSTLLDDSLLFNIAAHRTEYTNLLTQFQVPIGGIVQTFSRNGGEIDTSGIEVETLYLPSDNVTLAFNAAFLDAEFGVFGQTNPYQLLNGVEQGFVDVTGATPGWSPDFTASASASYDFHLAGGSTLTAHLQFYMSDGYNTGNLLSIDRNVDQDSFTKTDLRLIWNSADEKFSVEAFVENIEDEAVLARSNNGSNDNVQTGYNYPRNYGIRFRANLN